MNKFFLSFLLFISNTITAQKYVSNSNGNDGNIGTIISPYKTIKKGVTSCPVNQIVFVDPGTYLETTDIIITQAVKLTKWLTGAFNTGDVIIDAVDRVGDFNSIILINAASNVTIDNIKMKRLKGKGANAIFVQNGGDSISILNCRIENIGWIFDNLSAPFPDNTSCSAIKILNGSTTVRTKVLIKKDTIFNCAVGKGEAITISGNVNGFKVDSNLVHHISNIGIDAAGGYEIGNNPSTKVFRSRNGVISNNEVYRCMSGKGVSAGVYLDGSDSCTIEKNKCHNNAVGISFGAEEQYLPNTAPRGHIIRNNLIYSNSIFGMVLGANGNRTVQSVKVYNNLLFKNRTFETINNITSVGNINLLTSDPTFGGEISLQSSDNLVLKNNIIYRLNNRRAWNVSPGATVSNFTCNNNNYYQDTATIPITPIIDISTATFNGSVNLIQTNNMLNDFQTNWPGLEANAKELYPNFIDTAQKNFRLLLSSPLINKGEFTTLLSILGNTDYYGNTRIVCDTIDIGANEVIPIVSITNQPNNTVACLGTNVTFSITTLSNNVSYKWQESVNGGSTWSDISNSSMYNGANTNLLTLNNVTVAMNNYRYRCLVSEYCISINSSPAILTINNPPSISTQPTSSQVCINQNTSFSVVAMGTNLTYQWQVNTTGCSGTWTNLITNTNYSGVTNPTLQLSLIPVSINGYGYRCIISGACTPQAITNCSVLTVNSPISIITQPANDSACNNASTSFTIVANSLVGINYQWQVSTNAGSSFSNINGQVQSTLSLASITQSMNGNLYSCILTSISNCNSTITSSNVSLTVLPIPLINISTPNTSICEGTTSTLIATSGFQSYTWTPTAAGNTNSITISPTATTTYSVTGTALNGCTNNASSIITITPKPVITSLTASAFIILPQGQTTTIKVLANSPTSANLTYNWGYQGNGSAPLFSGNTYVVDFSHIGIYTVRVAETLNQNCISLPKSIEITGSTIPVEDTITIYPNVNNGLFYIRINSLSTTSIRRIIVIYNAKGALVYKKEIQITQLNNIFDIDLRKVSSGMYQIVLFNDDGKKIESKKVLITH